jgi:tetratricopeptide (TPR) repeat protein
MTGSRWVATAVTGLVLCASAAAGQDAADLAWRDGDTDTARRLYETRLAADSSDGRALHRLALMRAWEADHDASLALFDRLLELEPANVEAAVDRARTLAWAGRMHESEAAYARILVLHPDHRGARLGLAQMLAWDGRLGLAAELYEGLLAQNPEDAEALKGLARCHAWNGALVQGEALWRRATAAAPEDVEGLVGLAQTLRWQGREAAAAEVLDRALELALAWARTALAPRVDGRLSHESDSDGNRITTLTATTAWRPRPRLEMRARTYVRGTGVAGVNGSELMAGGVLFEGWLQVEPGWTVSAGAGASGSDVEGSGAQARLSASASSPRGHRAGASLSWDRAALDETARLIVVGVTRSDATASGWWHPGAGWRARSSASLGRYEGSEPNRRTAASAGVERDLPRRLTVGLATRRFSFEKNLNDGYFDPDLYVLAEGMVRWRGEAGSWRWSVEGAPGAQKAGSEGPWTLAVRTFASVGLHVAPAREIVLGLGYTNAAVGSLGGSEDAGYDYRVVRLSGRWGF